MSFFMIQFKYDDDAIKNLVKNPQDRGVQAQAVVESFGGKLHQFFFAFGEYDGIAITEFPNTENATACALFLGSTGAFDAMKTTVLIDSAEGLQAMKRANSTQTGYTPPAG